ncbi:NAD(P)/FAD-dependent oxidoreductase [Halococcus salifodinae]|uniref:Thioredoxin reductase n=1 Tax=Halococcus salifodinae DSM 8989 TaxID=1227456 RepID=M0N7U0_9EURY|nr:NAD(P)/FAD-dependent oxidoreductase [Halococcus salifodinae]EMA53189.1 thioredoxin reductase [Halococcus salifodinae DSM 8989]
MSPDRETDDVDVAIVGGGPTGCSAGVFTARYGLDTVIFDRGRSSIHRCAYLENYPGFPAGIDIETFTALLHDHATTAGCEIVPDLVESVERRDDAGFVIETQEDRRVTADRIVAATRYGGEYLQSLGDDAMFATHEHDGEAYERFDRSYADVDGRTPIDGCYVASPSDEADRQAIIAAGRGARTGHALIADVRRGRGYPDPIAKQYDWVRKEDELTDEWRDRERWAEWFDDRLPDDHDCSTARLDELCEREIDRRLDQYLSDEEIATRTRRGQSRLLEHVDDERVLERAREIEAERRAVETEH